MTNVTRVAALPDLKERRFPTADQN